MLTSSARIFLAFAAALSVGLTIALPDRAGAQTPAKKKSAPQAEKAPARSEQTIVILVNDEPITAWEVEQRTNFIAVNMPLGGPELKAKAEARWQQITKDPKINERFQQTLREKNVRSKEEAQAVQMEFIKSLQQNMLEQLKREARANLMPQAKKAAQEELIEERLKLQEAKKVGVEFNDQDMDRVLKGIADNNKMTLEQFAQHCRTTGFDVSTLRERFRAQYAWRDVIRRRFGPQVSISQRDVDRALSHSATEAGEDTVELQVHKISLPLSGGLDQSLMARRYAQADKMRANFAGCQSTADLAKSMGDARFEDLKFIKPHSITEPTRSLLLSAKDGDMLPPMPVAGGIEVYAVCGRRAIKPDEKQQQKAAEELQSREFELHARRHLLDLKQDAHIEYR